MNIFTFDLFIVKKKNELEYCIPTLFSAITLFSRLSDFLNSQIFIFADLRLSFKYITLFQGCGVGSRFYRLPSPTLAWKCLPTPDSSKNFFPTPTPQKFFPTPQIFFFRLRLLTPQNMPGLPTPTPKTCLSYNIIIVILKGSESACKRQFFSRKVLCLFYQIF